MKLSPMQQKVLYFLSQNLTNREIAEHMDVKLGTAETHLYNARDAMMPAGENWTREQFVEAAKQYCAREKQQREDELWKQLG